MTKKLACEHCGKSLANKARMWSDGGPFCSVRCANSWSDRRTLVDTRTRSDDRQGSGDYPGGWQA